MSPTTFTQLPRELRDLVWSAAAAVQYEQIYLPQQLFTLIPRYVLRLSTNFSIADGQPKAGFSPCAERLRQAFVGYDNLPYNTERDPLRVYVHNSHKKDKLCLGVNEFQTLVNCLPMATVCSEARSHAADFCRTQIKLMSLWYDADDKPNDAGNEMQEHAFVQPTAIMVTNANETEQGYTGFNSARHLVDVVNRVFGSGVEQIILSSWFNSHNSLEDIYWPHTAQTRISKDINPTFIDDLSFDPSMIFMTPKRTAHVREDLCDDNEYNLLQLAYHLLKFHEILDASTQTLPRLQSIELELHTYDGEDLFLTSIKATNKGGVLWVNWNDVLIGKDHGFAHLEI